jgi:hypothetical protein
MKLGILPQSGFQAFVDESSLRYPTAITGTPGDGVFYSSIINRSPVVDISKNLKVHFGIERIQTQQIFEIQGETGPNGERVFGVLNDTKGLIRFVGAKWVTSVGTSGPNIYSDNSGDYVEVTFFGTGLNLLSQTINDTRNAVASVDGGAEGSNILQGASGSLVLSIRNYPVNIVYPVVSGLTLGVHTVKIRCSATAISCFGFEILNESSTLKVSPGSAIMSSGKKTVSAVQSPAYNSSFDYGTLGTRGGRVVVYLKSDGTIGKAVQPVDSSTLTLNSASHTNEEIIRTYYPREFGAGRSDDFSIGIGVTSRTFTLDDGTTTLVGRNAAFGGVPEVLVADNNTDYIFFTFVGTGLDVVRADNFTTVDFTISIDDETPIALNAIGTANIVKQMKVVSGLPYGTHTVKFLRTSATNNTNFYKFIVYGPKKPSIPTGAVELADYNIMADFVANAVANGRSTSTGVLQKSSQREFTYVNGTGGTTDWAFFAAAFVNVKHGAYFQSDRLNAYVEYTFFGTGFDSRWVSGTTTANNIQVSLQSLSTGGSLSNLTSTNFPTATFSTYGMSTGGFTSSTGILNTRDSVGVYGAGFVCSGLPLGTYKVRFNNGTVSQFMYFQGLDIITSIHSPKANLYGDLQNTLLVGSCALSDNRVITPINKPTDIEKYRATAIGINIGPTISTTTAVPVADMSLTVKSRGAWFKITSKIVVQIPSTANFFWYYIVVDGIFVGKPIKQHYLVSNQEIGVYNHALVYLPFGVHKIDNYGALDVASGSVTLTGSLREISVEEL